MHASTYYRLYEEAQKVRERQAKRAEEITKAECTFKPKIKRSSSVTRSRASAAAGVGEGGEPSFVTRAMEYKQKVGWVGR